MDLGVTGPQRRTAGKAETGKACPYCRFPLKEGSDIVSCGACHACHHAECWQDNAGCAVVACAGGPPAEAHERTAVLPQAAPIGAAASEPAQAFQQPTAVTPPPSWQQPQPPPRRSRGIGPWLVAAALIVALTGAGVTAAIILGRKKPKTSAAVVLAPARRSPSASNSASGRPASPPSSGGNSASASPGNADAAGSSSSGAQNDGSTPSGSSNGLLPAESQDQMTQDIQQMLLQFHQDISDGNFQDAWSLLSARKQQQSLQESGYNGWIANQKSLGDYLDPSGLQVSIVSTDPSTGVATVNVTGMTWSPPNAAPCQWSGLTWVKYESGSWHYDPGYSTTSQRRAEWGPPTDTSSPAYASWKSNTWSRMMGGQCVAPG